MSPLAARAAMGYVVRHVTQHEGYQADLAFIHDAAFGDWARRGGEALLRRLEALGIRSGLVVELGCGSGISADLLLSAGYDVVGIDQSQAMVKLARVRAAAAAFVCASVFDVEIPRCRAVIAIGEVFNYRFEGNGDEVDALPKLFRRVYDALQSGGVFMFDLARSGRVPEGRTSGFRRVQDWAVLFESVEEGRSLTRNITAFRRHGESYHRTEEVHRLRLYEPPFVSSALIAAGFSVEVSDRFDDEPLAPGLAAFIAKKPN